MKNLLNEATLPATYEEYTNSLQKSIDENDYRTFQRLITDSIRQRKYEWFATFYGQKDSDGDLTKNLFKRLRY